jgi:hypothetical protein
MGMMGGFPGRRRVKVAGDRRHKADVASVSCWAEGGCAKLSAPWVDASALTLTARSSAVALSDHLVRAVLWFGGAACGYARTLSNKTRCMRRPSRVP